MKPEHKAIARYLQNLNATAARYRRARVEEFTARPLNANLPNVTGWPSNHTRVLAYMLASASIGRAAWGGTL